MKRIGFITDDLGDNSVRQALENIDRLDEYMIETVDDFQAIDSIIQSVWGLINLVDVLVVYASKRSSNLFYEIGLAHGFGIPVVIIANEVNILPADLKSQRIILVDSETYSLENLEFRIKESVKDATIRHRSFSGYRGPRENIREIPHPEGNLEIRDFRSLFSFEGFERGRKFEKWFANVARGVPGWEVIESERIQRRDQGFDIVIWNSRDDFELKSLGNPIAIELKSIRSMNAASFSSFLKKAKTSGLETIVLATTSSNDASAKKRLSRFRKEEGINAIALDKNDLLQVRSSEDLLSLFKQKTRELLYKEEY